jgi:hypothetical protein
VELSPPPRRRQLWPSWCAAWYQHSTCHRFCRFCRFSACVLDGAEQLKSVSRLGPLRYWLFTAEWGDGPIVQGV